LRSVKTERVAQTSGFAPIRDAQRLKYVSVLASAADLSIPSSFRVAPMDASSGQSSRRRDGEVLTPIPIGANRILIKEVNWLGDLVMSLPALRAIRGAFASCQLSVLVRQELAGFFDGMDWVDEVIPYTIRRGVRVWTDQLELIASLRARRFDLAVIFPNSFRSALWALLAGVPRRAGYATDGRRFLLTNRSDPKPPSMKGHQRFYWLDMVAETLGISSTTIVTLPSRLEISHRSVARMRGWLDAHRRNRDAPLIAISPAAAYGPAKEWPASRFAELIDLLDQIAGGECVLLGAASERYKCEQVASMSEKGAIVAAGETGVGELKSLLALCDGFAGNDSGIMHLAAAIGIPTVGIFGSTNPLRTGPLGTKARVIYNPVVCSPCLKRTCRFGHYQCLQGITSAEVAEALKQLGALKTSSRRDVVMD
jgi:heptosyltransferase II